MAFGAHLLHHSKELLRHAMLLGHPTWLHMPRASPLHFSGGSIAQRGGLAFIPAPTAVWYVRALGPKHHCSISKRGPIAL